MKIETIRRDLKEAGYALVDNLFTSEQLESIRIVSSDHFNFTPRKKICNHSQKIHHKV
jgi:hypothetical protein